MEISLKSKKIQEELVKSLKEDGYANVDFNMTEEDEGGTKGLVQAETTEETMSIGGLDVWTESDSSDILFGKKDLRQLPAGHPLKPRGM